MANNLCLRIVSKDQVSFTTRIIQAADLTDGKTKRGRPSKKVIHPSLDPPSPHLEPHISDPIMATNTTATTTAPVNHTVVIIPKKRGRKKKIESSIEVSTPTTITKSYIVHLKIKSRDLEKMQTQFIDKSQKIGYESTNLEITNRGEYYNLLNKLEIPYAPLEHKTTTDGQEGYSSSAIPNLYPVITIPISPAGVPINLFDENQVSPSLHGEESRAGSTGGRVRNTSAIMLPLLDSHGNWPEKSPYACWNCDSYFNGTPWGIPDTQKEPADGNYYCYGNFCSPGCVARYLCDHEDPSNFWEKYSALCHIYQKVYSLSPETKVPILPPKECLTKYGGNLSYEGYHSFAISDQKMEIYKLPLVPVLLHIGEMYRSSDINTILQNNAQKTPTYPPSVTKSKRFVPLDPIKCKQAVDSVNQKNSLMLKSGHNLDQCLGLGTSIKK
uniref:MYM-type domain-containing protein n=1 Tax=viral metagenome TaxID=1070528 RepID=A0A6C0BLJ0_9ZZZZ